MTTLYKLALKTVFKIMCYVRMSETRIALRRSNDEDPVSKATLIKTFYCLFDTYRVIRTFFSSVDLIYHYHWIVLIILLQAETKVFMIDWCLIECLIECLVGLSFHTRFPCNELLFFLYFTALNITSHCIWSTVYWI